MEVNEALQPHIDSLRELLQNPELANVHSIPAMEWLGKRDPLRTLIPCTGNLSVVDRARIANWFETHIAIDKKLQNTWLGLLPLAHTFTLFIGSQLLENPSRKTDIAKLSHQELLEMAWEIQVRGDEKLLWQEVDVERECLEKRCLSVPKQQELQENTSGVWMQVTIKMPGIHTTAFHIIGFMPIDWKMMTQTKK